MLEAANVAQPDPVWEDLLIDMVRILWFADVKKILEPSQGVQI